jgi:hypothetical protein
MFRFHVPLHVRERPIATGAHTGQRTSLNLSGLPFGIGNALLFGGDFIVKARSVLFQAVPFTAEIVDLLLIGTVLPSA